MSLTNLLTKKQISVLKSYREGKWKYLFLCGAIRSGKTVINNYQFVLELRRVSKLAKKLHVLHPQYILAGFSSDAINNNIIASLESQFGLTLKADRHGHYHLFGVDIVPAYTGNRRGVGKIRGMTAFGAYINEASLADEAVFNEIINRCSIEDARVVCDTNPDTPTHWLKTKYIDNQDENARIKVFNFTIDDNTFLPADYVKALKAATPKGMFYDRAIKGLWVTADGIVYQDFDKERMLVETNQIPEDLTYYAGVDWGFEHLNSIGVFGEDRQGNIYMLEEHTGKHKQIDYWVDVAQDIQRRYGSSIVFACDSARPDNINAFLSAGINARNANKAIMPGVECVSKYMASGKFFVNRQGVSEFLNEIYQYVWDEKTGMPVKEHDDVMDMMRYAIYTQHAGGGYVPWN